MHEPIVNGSSSHLCDILRKTLPSAFVSLYESLVPLLGNVSVKTFTRQKSPGYDPVTGKILKELPAIGIQYMYNTQLFNAVLLKGCFQAQWKVAQIMLIPKPGNSATPHTS
jgi:hypothetical protein